MSWPIPRHLQQMRARISSLSMDMAHSMLWMAIDIHAKDGSFVCRACGLLFQGFMLAYDPRHNMAEWLKFKGVVSDLMPAEESSTIKPLDYVPTQKQPLKV